MLMSAEICGAKWYHTDFEIRKVFPVTLNEFQEFLQYMYHALTAIIYHLACRTFLSSSNYFCAKMSLSVSVLRRTKEKVNWSPDSTDYTPCRKITIKNSKVVSVIVRWNFCQKTGWYHAKFILRFREPLQVFVPFDNLLQIWYDFNSFMTVVSIW